jgi:hypothetical protein
MARVPVVDWKTDWEVSTIIEVLREYYRPTADDSFVSSYDKWAALYKSMQKTITVDQTNIDQLRKSYSERLISTMEDYGDMHVDMNSFESLPTSLDKWNVTNATSVDDIINTISSFFFITIIARVKYLKVSEKK